MTAARIQFIEDLDPPDWPANTYELRQEVRAFLKDELDAGNFEPTVDTWLGSWDPAFSEKLGERGWLGMTWPKRYGGHERSSLERFAVLEELLSAGAPVAAHWIADRQTGPLLLRYGSESQRERYLPPIARGRRYFALGLSEPDTGSDLASVRTRAVPDGSGGWKISGTKLWTSGGHVAHHIVVLCRTGEGSKDKHEGLSQFIVELDAPGVTVRPIRLLTGEHHFNEVILDGAPATDEDIVGELGQGWQQVTSELAHERAGPERFLSVFQLLLAYLDSVQALGESIDDSFLGSVFAQLWTLHHMSAQVAGSLGKGESLDAMAALVKDVGTRFELELIEGLRVSASPATASTERFAQLLARATMHAPGFTLRGGTNEILRSIVVRGMGI